MISCGEVDKISKTFTATQYAKYLPCRYTLYSPYHNESIVNGSVQVTVYFIPRQEILMHHINYRPNIVGERELTNMTYL